MSSEEGTQDHTEAERLRSAEFTLATIRETAERSALLGNAEGVGEHARGYGSAMRDVLAILDARWLPEHVPVHFGQLR